jgi:hypothetical protein
MGLTEAEEELRRNNFKKLKQALNLLSADPVGDHSHIASGYKTR